jgi:hypothetical protein
LNHEVAFRARMIDQSLMIAKIALCSEGHRRVK